MTKVRTWAGLDVHAAKTVACAVDSDSGEMTVHRLPGATGELVCFCAGLPGPTRVAYEAGPTGFALARALRAAGIRCVVAAPGKIERPAADRVKTDQRDAERLVRLAQGIAAEKRRRGERSALLFGRRWLRRRWARRRARDARRSDSDRPSRRAQSAWPPALKSERASTRRRRAARRSRPTRIGPALAIATTCSRSSRSRSASASRS
jgi:transposase